MSKLYKYVVLLGAYKMTVPLFGVCLHYYNRFYRESMTEMGNDARLRKTYGDGKWAIVTGASEGIGKEFALQLARSGFNVCISSRSMAKLEQVQQEIKHASPSV